MKMRQFGHTGVDVSVIGQGTWHLEDDDANAARTALEAGLDTGMTHIDTAELYGSGRVEQIIAPLVRRRRDEMFLVSKVLPSNASRDKAIAACERSLERLGTDRLDVYLLHWRGGTPLEETFRAFEALERDGKIRAFGFSNFDVDDLEEAQALAGSGRIACNQVLYHLGERAIEHRVVPWCREHGVPVVAYSPFGSGRFVSMRSDGGRVLDSIAAQRGISARQVALTFLVQHGGVFAIPKAARVEHALDNAAAGKVELTADELHALDEAFPVGARRGLPII